jgi:hypothetical protein
VTSSGSELHAFCSNARYVVKNTLDERNGESRCKMRRLKVLRQSFGEKDIMSLASTVYVPQTTDEWTE